MHKIGIKQQFQLHYMSVKPMHPNLVELIAEFSENSNNNNNNKQTKNPFSSFQLKCIVLYSSLSLIILGLWLTLIQILNDSSSQHDYWVLNSKVLFFSFLNVLFSYSRYILTFIFIELMKKETDVVLLFISVFSGCQVAGFLKKKN